MTTSSDADGQTRPVPADPPAPRAVAAAQPGRTDPTGALLQVSGLHVAYAAKRRRVAAVRGVDLTVARGEVVALVGESGSGKSSLAHAVLRLLPAAGQITAGAIHFDGHDLLDLTPERLRALRGTRIALIPQDATAFLNPTRRIGSQVAEVRRIHGLADRRTAAQDAVHLLDTAGLPDPERVARQYPYELSGGMRQRVLIAAALGGEPDLILADEPTSALDVTVQHAVLDHLRRLVDTLGIALLLITHDLGIAADRAHRVLVMHQGTIVEAGPPSRVLRAPTHPYTRRLVDAAPRPTGPRLIVTVRDRVAAATEHRPHAEAQPSGADSPLSPQPRATIGLPAAPDPVLTLDRVSHLYSRPATGGGRRDFPAVDDVSLVLGRGQSLGLVGESGSGKSTLARIAACLQIPSSGSVQIAGQDAVRRRAAERRQLRRQVQLVQQSPYASLDPRMRVGRSITEPLRAFGVGDRASRRAAAADLADQVGLPAVLLDRRPGELSGGQRQRVAIARALALRPALLICDEPVSALDVTTQSQILDLLARLHSEHGVSYLFISHDLAVVRQICERIAVMRAGRIIEAADTTTMFDRPAEPYTRRLLEAIPGRR
ncbi:glutathione ABC transporter ATP binding subunit GsiA [Frankia sp. AiPs1]|uniref:dipeptide ABC transporter ATP-binding protein n=1 Tax=Frankia sp. AiPa1 TaxID=573492 RepID=UPI00202ADFAF|nr:ABC transporter ATP-binding protein [Frankia sp. AiPa1]MCL9760513.1 ABC transporter ATP-binding protein [Frankia sp. AiPa1]